MKKYLKPLVAIVLAGMSIAWLNSCNDKDSEPGARIKIEGLHLVDPSGNDAGHYGPADDDWIFVDQVTDEIAGLFNFQTSIDLSNTVKATVVRELKPMPNPMIHEQRYNGNISDSSLLKIVIVNDNLDVLLTKAFKVKGDYMATIDLSNRTVFPEKRNYRVYYSLSALNYPNYLVGYGDIRVCPNTGEDCFK